MATLTFKEKVDTEQPGSAGFSKDSARAIGYYLLDEGSGVADAITLDDLQSAITTIIGSTTYDAGPGNIQRQPPASHPQFPWLFAANINKMWGIGQFALANAAQELEVPPINAQFSLYKQYWFAVDFVQFPYPVALDSDIPLVQGQWYPETSGGTAAQTFTYAAEWYRFTDYSRIPQPSADKNITQNGGAIGTMSFQTSSGSPNGLPFPGTVTLPLPNAIIRYIWYGVPYRYVLSPNSYFDRWRNRVNQNAWNGLGFTVQPGELLYLDYEATKYTPPVQQEDLAWPGVFASQKLCDITFTFLYTKRTATLAPAAPSNKNYVIGGHNILPWFNTPGQFYYAKTAAGVPSYLSYPLEATFSDPDAQGGIAP